MLMTTKGDIFLDYFFLINRLGDIVLIRIYFSLLLSGISYDLESITRGMAHYGPQLIFHLQCYRQAIIETFKSGYLPKLFDFNRSILL